MFLGMIPRKTYDPGGFGYEITVATRGKCDPLPPDVAGIEWESDGRFGGKKVYVTWAEVMRRRRERQAEELQRKRDCHSSVAKRAVLVRVFFNLHWVYHGWHTYLYTLEDRQGHWIRYYKESDNPYGLMTLFPFVSPKYPLLGPVKNFREWMPLFARAYEHRRRGGKPEGSACCWGMCSDSQVEELLPRTSCPSC